MINETVMQELMRVFTERPIAIDFWIYFNQMLFVLRDKEKQQLCNAFDKGNDNGMNISGGKKKGTFKTAQSWFESTYPTPGEVK